MSRTAVGSTFAVLAAASAVAWKVLLAPPASKSTPALKPTIEKSALLSLLETSLANVKQCTTNIYVWSKAKSAELKKRRRALDPSFLDLAKATYEKELAVLDARALKAHKTTESQVSVALDHFRDDKDVKEAVAEITNAGPKFTFEADELLALYKDIFEVQLLHMEDTADKLAESGYTRGSSQFQATIRSKLQDEAEGIKRKQLAMRGLSGIESFLEANLDMFCRNDNAVAIKFNQLMSEQQRRAVACGASAP